MIFAKGHTPLQFGCEVEKKIMNHWIPRKSQIALVELFATIVAMEILKDLLQNSWSLLCLLTRNLFKELWSRATPTEQTCDMCELVGLFWQVALDLRINIYIDRVSTDANPADPPSRDRMEIGRAV